MMEIKLQELTDLSVQALIKAGLDENEARLAADHYLENEFSGKASHGLVRVVEAVRALHSFGAPDKPPEVEFENDQVLRFNANRNIGSSASWHAMRAGIKKAASQAVTFVSVRNYIASTGAMSFYLRRITDAGYIGLMGCNSVALVTPVGGKKRMIGTNPFAIGIPDAQGQTPMIADFATSSIAYGKVMVMKNKGQSLPEGKIVDAEGHPSTDPADAYNGAILPLADHRGFALGLMIELLAGPLIGAKALKQELYDNDGLYMIFINPDHFGLPDVHDHLSGYLKQVLDTPLAPGAEPIALPGMRSAAKLEKTLKTGCIDVAEKTLDDLKDLLKERAA